MKVKKCISFEELKTLQGVLEIDNTFQKKETLDVFQKAWEINWKLSLEMMFYLRDCRGGKGLRQQFYWIARFVACNYPNIFIDYLNKIPHYGCWKDLWELMETPVHQEIIDMYIAALVEDKKRMNNRLPVSFSAKWFPSEGSALDKEHDVVLHLSLSMNLAPSHIRKYFITPLRKYIDVCETHMSRNNWKDINFSKQSGANYKYRKCFNRHFREKFTDWQYGYKKTWNKPKQIDILEFQGMDRYRLRFKEESE